MNHARGVRDMMRSMNERSARGECVRGDILILFACAVWQGNRGAGMQERRTKVL